MKDARGHGSNPRGAGGSTPVQQENQPFKSSLPGPHYLDPKDSRYDYDSSEPAVQAASYNKAAVGASKYPPNALGDMLAAQELARGAAPGKGSVPVHGGATGRNPFDPDGKIAAFGAKDRATRRAFASGMSEINRLKRQGK